MRQMNEGKYFDVQFFDDVIPPKGKENIQYMRCLSKRVY